MFSIDNKVFNVNGRTKKQLELAIKLLLLDEYDKNNNVNGWYFREDKGLVLTWYVGDRCKAQPFTDRMGNVSPIDEKELVEIIWNWLQSDQAKTVKLDGWDREFDDSDVECELGWRLYTEEWGHIGERGGGSDHYSIAAVTPSYMWYGK